MKDKILRILATTASVIFHPLLLPTYGFTLIAVFNMLGLETEGSWVYYAVAVAGTFIFTFIIPISLILILRHQKRVSSIRLDNQQERSIPYIYAFVAFAIWCYFIRRIMHIEAIVFLLCCAATISIGIVALINMRWKISAHLTGMGCFIGGVLIMTSMNGTLSNMLIIGLFLIALILTYSRLYLKSHTPLQVTMGLILGLSMSLLTLLI